MSYDFDEMLEFSRGVRKVSDHETIKAMIPGCVTVEDSSQLLDTSGTDYIARLRRGATILIDAKTRTKGCSKYWRNDPEFALESWSVRPGGKYKTPDSRKKVGWTLCEAKNVDLILFKFDPTDTTQVFLVSFQLLRAAFRQQFHAWFKSFKVDVQDSNRWESEAVFVPSTTVYQAMQKASIGQLKFQPTAP